MTQSATVASTSSAARNSSTLGSCPDRQAKLTETPAKVGAGQAGEAARRLAGLTGQHAFAAVAEVDREEQLDRQPRRVLAERRGGRRVAEQDAVGDLGRRRDLVGLRRPQ